MKHNFIKDATPEKTMKSLQVKLEGKAARITELEKEVNKLKSALLTYEKDNDLEVFKRLLDKAGFTYETQSTRFSCRVNNCDISIPTRTLVVQGCFYDELEIEFTRDDFQLLNMVSHVAYNRPSCMKAEEVTTKLIEVGREMQGTLSQEVDGVFEIKLNKIP